MTFKDYAELWGKNCAKIINNTVVKKCETTDGKKGLYQHGIKRGVSRNELVRNTEYVVR